MTRSLRRTLSLAATVAAIAVGLVAAAAPVDAATLPRIAGFWSHVAALPGAVEPRAVTAGRGGRLYVFGVCQSSCRQLGGRVGFGAAVTEVYHPAARRWVAGRGAPQICAKAQAAAVDPGGQIHLAGCWKDEVTDPGVRVAIYDPRTATWTMEPGHGPFANPIAGMTGPSGSIEWFSEALVRQSSAVFVGGYRVLIDEDGLWFGGLTVPNTAPSDAAVRGRDGRIYAFGGWRNCQPEFGPCPVPPVQAYRPLTNAWSQVTRQPVRLIRVAAATDALGRIFVMGGLAPDGHAVARTVQVYRPKKHSWATTRPLPRPVMDAIATATPDGSVWILGGFDSGGHPLSDGFVFHPRR